MEQKENGKQKKKIRKILAICAGTVLAAAGIAVVVFAYKVIIGATYRTDDVADYGEFEGFQGYSQLLTFPEDLLESAEPEAKIKQQVFVSFNGEIQGFEADSSGMLRNIEQLAYLAPRGGLGMEAEAENVPGDSNPYLSESAGMRDMDEILTSESGLTWVRISGRSSVDSGERTSVPEHGDIAAYVQEEDLYIAKETGEKDLWNIWKLPGYGEWMEQEIRIFLRVMTGMEYGGAEEETSNSAISSAA